MPRASARSRSDVAYKQVRAIALRFPSAEEKLSHGAPSFHVRGKMFLTFVDNHHGDGRLAVWCKAAHEDQRRLVEDNPSRFFVPPYVGVRGWVGVNVDPADADWIELSILVEEAWRSVAPASVVREGKMATAPPLPPKKTRVTTDAGVAREAFERLTSICLALAGATRETEGRHATFRVGKKVFAYFLDNHHGGGAIAACFRGDKGAHARLVAVDPGRFFLPAYIGSRGYLGVRLDVPELDWEEVARRAAKAHALVASSRARAVATATTTATARAKSAHDGAERATATLRQDRGPAHSR